MIKLIEEIIIQRQARNDDNDIIQLSTVFMKKAIESFNNQAGAEIIKFNPETTEFKYMYFGKRYFILNRAYRDDTNDPDVEQVIIDVLNLK